MPWRSPATASPRRAPRSLASRTPPITSWPPSRRSGSSACTSSGTPTAARLLWRGHWKNPFALRAALDAPERIASLTLIDSAGLPRAEGGWLPEEVEMREHPLADWGWLLNSPERITTALAPHFVTIPPDRVEEFHLVCSNRRNWEAMIALVRDENGSRAHELSDLEAPTLLLWGADDIAYLPEREGRGFQERLPNATLQVVAGSGHYPFEDQPGEVIALLEQHFETVERDG